MIPMVDEGRKTCCPVGIEFLVGNKEQLEGLSEIRPLLPFSDLVMGFCDALSSCLMKDSEAKQYPDVVTFAFWIRKAALEKQKERFSARAGAFRVGRGVAFHIAPSNVPVNFAYSLAVGLLTGNANVVRVPAKDFPQVTLISRAITKTIKNYSGMVPYICLVRYGHEKEINDWLSEQADVRILWGGDQTIEVLRQSRLRSRSTEVAFADRYSLCVMEAVEYLSRTDKERVAEDFYNDTYLSDQNACTAPHLVAWLGEHIEEAAEEFWGRLYQIAAVRYPYQPIQSINKLTMLYKMAAELKEGRLVGRKVGTDSVLVRVQVDRISKQLTEYRENGGYFLEYYCGNIMDLLPLCGVKCQTISYIGKKEHILPLLQAGAKGIDRIVPVGKTMDFDFIWDGYNLVERLTREVYIL